MSRTSKPERRKAKQQMLTFKQGQRNIKALLRMARFITLPGVPEKNTVGEWARHLRHCEANHHAWVALKATVHVREVDSTA